MAYSRLRISDASLYDTYSSSQYLDIPYESTPQYLSNASADNDLNSVSSTSRLRRRDSEPLLAKTPSRPNSGQAWRRLSGGPAWEHKLSEKHIGKIPSHSSSARYFDRNRQTRRVFLDCLWMWLGTAATCASMAAVLLIFHSIKNGISQWQKYTFNTLINGLLLILGIAFAAQFKQYCEMLRWRFLASSYRSLEDFEEVLDCDSWRSATRLIFKRKHGSWRPTKAQLVAAVWVLVFTAFNIFASALGLTYSIDISNTTTSLVKGIASVLTLEHIQMIDTVEDLNDYGNQMSAANYWGQVGQTFYVGNKTDQMAEVGRMPKLWTVWPNKENDTYWYRFLDADTDTQSTWRSSARTVNSTAKCEEYTILPGPDPDVDKNCMNSTGPVIYWQDQEKQKSCLATMGNIVYGGTTWMGVDDPFGPANACGDRCAEIFVLSVGQDVDETKTFESNSRLWHCTNTIGHVLGLEKNIYNSSQALKIPNDQASMMAGAIGWTGLWAINTTEETGLQYSFVLGLNGPFKVDHDAFNSTDIAHLIMRFSMGAYAAMDQFGGFRVPIGGPQPGPASVLNVTWWQAGPMLIGLPVAQFVMLLGVVWLSRKAIILEPSYLTAAHLFFPVMQKLGHRGVLMTADEISEAMGPDFKIAYAVRPGPDDLNTRYGEIVRDLDLVEEGEGFGYIRGQMPEGRYG